ncbi:RNA-splicing ligase RtcB [bacterium D16-76]|nr:RNA-splicing ligase RtcB [bacterium D16-76]
MEIITGKYTEAKVYTSGELESYARAQLQMLCDNECLAGSRIRVMPDVHPGKVGTIGLTMTVGERLMPFLTGIDIGCGVTMARIRKGKREWDRLDSVIKSSVPAGFASRQKPHAKATDFDFSRLYCAKHIRSQRAALALGTLGSGNHFIEVGTDGDSLYLFIHSGSRILGKEVTEHYVAKGQIELKAIGIKIPYELTWLDGALLQAYLHDAAVLQEYAELNRQIMIAEILKGMKWKADEMCSCPHNYIAADPRSMEIFGAPILRKGAIAAMQGERVIIPIHMRDGVILGTGLGNIEWNCSAPHGAGRILKREDVRQKHTMSEYKMAMKGVHSMSISADTLDEAPFAYRSLEEIAGAVSETVKIDKIIRPVYNFKAGDRR